MIIISIYFSLHVLTMGDVSAARADLDISCLVKYPVHQYFQRSIAANIQLSSIVSAESPSMMSHDH